MCSCSLHSDLCIYIEKCADMAIVHFVRILARWSNIHPHMHINTTLFVHFKLKYWGPLISNPKSNLFISIPLSSSSHNFKSSYSPSVTIRHFSMCTTWWRTGTVDFHMHAASGFSTNMLRTSNIYLWLVVVVQSKPTLLSLDVFLLVGTFSWHSFISLLVCWCLFLKKCRL